MGGTLMARLGHSKRHSSLDKPFGTWQPAIVRVSSDMPEVIGFKEWQVVCDALASGRQSIILRKGGIHEGRAGFSFAHESFFLFPTRFHAQYDQVKEGHVEPMPEWRAGDTIRITHFAEALWAKTLTDRVTVEGLAPYHIYADEVVADRFDWEGKGMNAGSIHVALVRILALAQPWEFPYEPKFGGCRTWLNLPDPPPNWHANPKRVLSDEAFTALRAELESLVA
jgi:hypothetical protein